MPATYNELNQGALINKLGTRRAIVKESNPKPFSSIDTILIDFVTEQILGSARAMGEP